MGNVLGNNLRTWGTLWEHIRNMMGTREKSTKKKTSPTPPKSQKEKIWTPHESMLSLSLAAWNFYFQNCLSPFLSWANGMATNPKKEKRKKFLPQTLPQKEKNQTVHTEPFVGWMQLLFPNFSPGLIPLLKNRDTYLHNDLDCMILHNFDSCSFSSIPKVIWPLWKFIIGEIWLVAFQKNWNHTLHF